MTQHTPGPWTVSEIQLYGFNIHGDGVWLGTVHGDHQNEGERPSEGFPGNNEADANARLIAASPYLLQTLEAIAEMAVDEDTDHAQLSALLMAMAKTAIKSTK